MKHDEEKDLITLLRKKLKAHVSVTEGHEGSIVIKFFGEMDKDRILHKLAEELS